MLSITTNRRSSETRLLLFGYNKLITRKSISKVFSFYSYFECGRRINDVPKAGRNAKKATQPLRTDLYLIVFSRMRREKGDDEIRIVIQLDNEQMN